MKRQDQSRLRRRRLRPWLGAAMIVFSLAICACASLPSSYRKAPEKLLRDVTAASPYKPKVGLLNVANLSVMQDQNLEGKFQELFTRRFKSACTDAILITARDPVHSDFLNTYPKLESGAIDNFALSNAGRAEGYNAVITGAVGGIAIREQRKGLWSFRKNHYYLQLLVFVDVYDMHDAAKIYSEPVMKEFEVTPEDAQKIKAAETVELPVLKQTIEKIAEDAAAETCAAIESQTWKGFVVAAEDKQVKISSGSAQGIQAGQQFEVYDAARTMEGFGGQKFYVPGFQIGEIQISRVQTGQAEAKVLTEKPIPVGSIVVPKL